MVLPKKNCISYILNRDRLRIQILWKYAAYGAFEVKLWDLTIVTQKNSHVTYNKRRKHMFLIILACTLHVRFMLEYKWTVLNIDYTGKDG